MNLEAEMLPGPDDVDEMFASAKPLARPARHSPECKMAFGHLMPAGMCARCDQLRAGHAPIRWQALRRERDAQAVADIASCFGPVCTFGDW